MSALPSSYTASTLAEFLLGELTDVAGFLGWENTGYPDGHFDEVVNNVLLALGLTSSATLPDITDVAKVRAIGRLMVWKAAKAKAVLAVNFSADGVSVSRDQIMAHINSMLSDAEYDAAQYGVVPGYTVEVVPIDYPASPYGLRDRTYYDANPS